MATKFRVGRSWYLQWWDRDQKKQCKQCLGHVTETEAEAALQGRVRKIEGAHSAAGPAFGHWAVEYAAWHALEYPDSYYRVEQILRCHLIPTLGTLPIGTLDRRIIETYKHERLQEVSAGTVTKELRTLQACMNKAVEWEVIPANPIRHVKAPRDLSSKPPRWYSAEELTAIYAAGLSYGPVWQLMANTGIRRGEAQALRWQDVGKEEIQIVSTPGARTKSGKWRIVPITEGAKMALEQLGTKRGLVVPKVTPFTLSRAFERTVKRVDMDGSLHCLRHTYCSHLVMAGVNLRTVQVLAGHASFKTTERYAHLAPGYLKDQIAGLNI